MITFDVLPNLSLNRYSSKQLLLFPPLYIASLQGFLLRNAPISTTVKQYSLKAREEHSRGKWKELGEVTPAAHSRYLGSNRECLAFHNYGATSSACAEWTDPLPQASATIGGNYLLSYKQLFYWKKNNRIANNYSDTNVTIIIIIIKAIVILMMTEKYAYLLPSYRTASHRTFGIRHKINED